MLSASAQSYILVILLLSPICIFSGANGEFISIGSTSTTKTKTFYTNFEAPGSSCGDIEMPWMDVLEFCRDHNMKGARVESAIENRLVTDAMKHTEDCSHVFIAATDLEEYGNWRWFNGNPVEYSNFTTPRNETYNSCASIHVHEDGEWHDEPCSYTIRPLCQTYETLPPNISRSKQDGFTSIGSVVETVTKTLYADIEGTEGRCSLTEMSWFETVKFCEEKGLTIARTESFEEIELVTKVFFENTSLDCSHFWLSGTTFGNHGGWYWFMEGIAATVGLDGFINWGPDYPGSDNEYDCMTLYEHGNWYNRPCNSSMRPLCQKVEKVQTVLSEHL